MELKGKIALVTGGSRGIGRAVVEAFAREGATVYFTFADNEAAAKGVCDAAGLDTGRAIRADVRDRATVKSTLAILKDAEGRLDILVNNAGINKPTDFDQITDDDWDNIMAVNLRGPFVVTQESLDLLRRSTSGSVIHIGSVSGQYGGPRTAHYAASKAGLISLSQVIARFLAKDRIRSNTLAAGLIDSDMAASALNNAAVQAAAESVLMKRMGRLSEVAEAAIFLASERSSYVTGQTLNVNGGLYF